MFVFGDSQEGTHLIMTAKSELDNIRIEYSSATELAMQSDYFSFLFNKLPNYNLKSAIYQSK